jgi:probable F420-dependent oxidoreductase
MPRPIHFGIVSAGAPSRDEWIALARRTEELGYSSLLMPDRAMTPLAPWSALATVAAVTTTLRVGSHVFANDFRHPVIVAREAATLDLLSNGRFELGLGAGVSQSDYEQLGLPFDSPGARVSRVAEALQIIKQFFTQEVVNFSGKYYTVTNLPAVPRPVQRPHPPIFIGSIGRRMLTLAAREADSVGPESRPARPGDAEADATREEKVAWIREAAGDRFDHLELCQTIFDLVITDSPAPATPPRWSNMPLRQMTIEEAVTYLRGQHERFGFSYFHASATQLENLAPVVARLTPP